MKIILKIHLVFVFSKLIKEKKSFLFFNKIFIFKIKIEKNIKELII